MLRQSKFVVEETEQEAEEEKEEDDGGSFSFNFNSLLAARNDSGNN